MLQHGVPGICQVNNPHDSTDAQEDALWLHGFTRMTRSSSGRPPSRWDELTQKIKIFANRPTNGFFLSLTCRATFGWLVEVVDNVRKNAARVESTRRLTYQRKAELFLARRRVPCRRFPTDGQ